MWPTSPPPQQPDSGPRAREKADVRGVQAMPGGGGETGKGEGLGKGEGGTGGRGGGVKQRGSADRNIAASAGVCVFGCVSVWVYFYLCVFG